MRTMGEGVLLVVMADETEAMDLVKKLGGSSGRRVLVARSVAEGWRMFGSSAVVGVIIDAVLPDGSGVDLHRWIAARAPRIPSMITGGPEDELPPYAQLRDGKVVMKPGVDESKLPPPPPIDDREVGTN